MNDRGMVIIGHMMCGLSGFIMGLVIGITFTVVM